MKGSCPVCARDMDVVYQRQVWVLFVNGGIMIPFYNPALVAGELSSGAPTKPQGTGDAVLGGPEHPTVGLETENFPTAARAKLTVVTTRVPPLGSGRRLRRALAGM